MVHWRDVDFAALDACARVLEDVLRTLREADVSLSDSVACGALFNGLVVDGFNFRSLETVPDRVRRSQGKMSTEGEVRLRIEGTGSYPFMATFWFVGTAWRLGSLQIGCPVCLGGAVHAGASCAFCDGTGFVVQTW